MRPYALTYLVTQCFWRCSAFFDLHEGRGEFASWIGRGTLGGRPKISPPRSFLTFPDFSANDLSSVPLPLVLVSLKIINVLYGKHFTARFALLLQPAGHFFSNLCDHDTSSSRM